MVDATGTVRRLQALARQGWTAVALGERLGLHWSYVATLRRGGTRCPRVEWSTYVAVRALYRELADTVSLDDPRMARRAAKCGWAPPIAWDEDTIDDPQAKPQHEAADSGEISEVELGLLLSGAAPPSTSPFRSRHNALAAQILRERGLTVTEIAKRLKLNERSVARILAINDAAATIKPERDEPGWGETTRAVAALTDEGLSINEVCQRLVLARNVVSRCLATIQRSRSAEAHPSSSAPTPQESAA